MLAQYECYFEMTGLDNLSRAGGRHLDWKLSFVCFNGVSVNASLGYYRQFSSLTISLSDFIWVGLVVGICVRCGSDGLDEKGLTPTSLLLDTWCRTTTFNFNFLLSQYLSSCMYYIWVLVVVRSCVSPGRDGFNPKGFVVRHMHAYFSYLDCNNCFKCYNYVVADLLK